ncbi:hypothetical protein BGZ95_008053 [Linnemannia exigua]|uniref:DUF833-domain-containing protein n=1 Tax=Linnemannia exigua TaxID=604196 RepID=A0AAD4DF19_9FUNG|nr:hypothetical protein BGZ95_008053 [Linnemannia exigua]
MCILLWTLPSSNHPRFKFALASNRDEFLGRETSRADFWDLDPVLTKAIQQSQPLSSNNVPVPALTEPHPSPVGVLTGQDLQPSQATNYTIQEVFSFSNQEEQQQQEEQQVGLVLDTKDIPGTWLGMTTHGDFVALTNFRESEAYMAEKRDPKLSRGKVCGEFLVTMAAAHHMEQQEDDEVGLECAERNGAGATGAADQIVSTFRSKNTSENRVKKDQAEKWIRRRAVGWEDEFEGLNLLVVQNAGDQQCVGGNRLGSELTVFNKSVPTTTTATTSTTTTTTEVGAERIVEGSIVGVSNSVFTQPWAKVTIGAKALECVLNKSIALFGTELHASYKGNTYSNNSSASPVLEDDTKEIAWLVVQMLTLLRTNTQPFPPEVLTSAPKLALGLRERVFIPRVEFGGPTMEYGTRSSTITLFGRERHGKEEGAGGGVAVLVEKVWYGERDSVTGKRTEYTSDSSEGLVWWQGRVGQPRQQWRRVIGEELEVLLKHARDSGRPTQA